jgi:hypothetical protein
MQDRDEQIIANLYPDLPPEQQAKAERNLKAYIDVMSAGLIEIDSFSRYVTLSINQLT